MKTSLLTIMILLIITACTPDQFWLNERTDYPVSGLIMSSLDSFKLKGTDGFRLYGGGRAALRLDKITQFCSDFSANIISGDGFKVALRSVSDNYDKHPNILFEVTNTWAKVYDDGKLLATVDSTRFSRGKSSRIHIINDGDVAIITLNCDTVIKTRTELPNTEYLIFSTIGNSVIDISGINFDELYKGIKLLK